MNNQEILTEAIEKAIAGGWNQVPFLGNDWDRLDAEDVRDVVKLLIDHEEGWRLFLFNHDFAKALWGIHPMKIIDREYDIELENWQVHLQQMVIADDPIQYLKEKI